MTPNVHRRARSALPGLSLVALFLLAPAAPLLAQRGGAAAGRGGTTDTLPLATPRPLRFTTDEGTRISRSTGTPGKSTRCRYSRSTRTSCSSSCRVSSRTRRCS